MKRILVVDDSPNWVRYHENALRMLFDDKVTIYTANSASEGVEKLMLPLYAGEWFIKQIKFFKEYKNTKIVIISAASDIRAIAEKYGTDYIPKYACRNEGAYDKIGDL